ncbi:MAG: hypothetical protein QG621_504 [Patescibacteria group bacterium]|nr:hypothetical protein [Patescibacteria group bacterium]
MVANRTVVGREAKEAARIEFAAAFNAAKEKKTPEGYLHAAAKAAAFIAALSRFKWDNDWSHEIWVATNNLMDHTRSQEEGLRLEAVRSQRV